MRLFIKLATKADITAGRIKSLKVEDWEITIFNVNGKYCFYTRRDKTIDINSTLLQENLRGEVPSAVELISARPELVIEGEDIYVLIDSQQGRTVKNRSELEAK